MRNSLYIFNSKTRLFLRIIAVIVVSTLLFSYINKVLQFKYGDGISVLDTFYSLENNTVDVLVLGSSHSFEDINPAILYEEHGMASFVLAASAQPMWNTYYYLKEALKTQKPELIVLECFCTTHTWNYGNTSHIIKSTYGLKWSKDKWDAIKVSVSEEDMFDYFPQYLQFHNRYEDLTSADFLPYQGRESYYRTWKGHGDNMATEPFEDPMFVEPTNGLDLLEKIEQYYRMIIELAQEEAIPICVVVSPCADLSIQQQQRLYRAKQIAEEYGVLFKDFNYCSDEIELDYAEDFADPVHLNYKGNEKYTRYLADFLKENFTISNRKEDVRYSSWQDNMIVREHNINNFELPFINDIGEYQKRLEMMNQDQDYYIVVTSSEEDSYGVHRVMYKGMETVYDSEMDGGELIYNFSKWNTLYLDGTVSIKMNNIEYNKLEKGYNVLVYDDLLQCVVDSFGIKEGENVIIR